MLFLLNKKKNQNFKKNSAKDLSLITIGFDRLKIKKGHSLSGMTFHFLLAILLIKSFSDY